MPPATKNHTCAQTCLLWPYLLARLYQLADRDGFPARRKQEVQQPPQLGLRGNAARGFAPLGHTARTTG